jgi:hypothetical protein
LRQALYEWATIRPEQPFPRCKRVYRELLPLRELLQFFSAQLKVTQDLAEQSSPDRFPGVHRHNGVPAVRMSKEMVATANTRNREACAAEGRCQFSAGEPGISAHAAMTTR